MIPSNFMTTANFQTKNIPIEEGFEITVKAVNDARLCGGLVDEIKEAFQNELEDWKVDQDNMKDLYGCYVLSVCELVEWGNDDEYISVPMEVDGLDAGYLHVYGWKEL